MADEHDNHDDVDPRRLTPEEIAALPDRFTVEYVKKMSARDMLGVEKCLDELTEGQRSSFKEARREAFPGLFAPGVMAGILRNAMPSIYGVNSPISKAARAAMPTMPSLYRQDSPLMKSIADQQKATNRLIESVNRATPTPIERFPRASGTHVPAVRSLEAGMRARAEREEAEKAELAEQQRALIELTATISQSTVGMAKAISEQNRRIEGQGALTLLLAFAVVYDVINSSFDKHTIWTTVVSAVGGVTLPALAVLLWPLWVHRERGASRSRWLKRRRDEDDTPPPT